MSHEPVYGSIYFTRHPYRTFLAYHALSEPFDASFETVVHTLGVGNAGATAMLLVYCCLRKGCFDSFLVNLKISRRFICRLDTSCFAHFVTPLFIFTNAYLARWGSSNEEILKHARGVMVSGDDVVQSAA